MSRRATAGCRALTACGVVAPLLFVAVFLVAGAVRPGYDPMRHPVSSLALGPGGIVQVANFLVTGGLLIVFAVGVRRRDGGRWAPLLLGLVGVGMLGAGVAAADPIGGYPPGTPDIPAPTTGGTVHNVASAMVFLGLPAAALVVARRAARAGRRRWARISVGAAVAFLACFVATTLGFRQLVPALAPVAGLLQRITLVIGLGWIAALALRRRPTARRSAGPWD